MFTVAFTGHRPDRLFGYDPTAKGNQEICDWMERHIVRLARHHKDITFITGGALGVDQWAAQIVHRVRDENPDLHIKSLIAVPCAQQDKKWPKKSKDLYQQILQDADEIHYVSDQPYDSECMQNRNEWMVDHAKGLLAVWNRRKGGGTFNCVEYALLNGTKILGYDPIKQVQYKIEG